LDNIYEITDISPDILSHPERKDRIYILTLDHVLATDIYSRMFYDKRLKHYQLIRPRQQKEIDKMVEEIDEMSRDTITSRLMIIDVRRATLPRLQRIYNAIVGYNRRDLNKFCYIILIGDGPVNLFSYGKSLDAFVPFLSGHRVDFHPAVFFFDPFIHYEANEIELSVIGEKFELPDQIPKRLIPFFKQDRDLRVDNIRNYFRATDKDEEIKKKRLARLKNLYKQSFTVQFPENADQIKSLLSRNGLRIASEKLNLYPLYFEDRVCKLLRKAKKQQTS
jgi:hypothetical protein